MAARNAAKIGRLVLILFGTAATLAAQPPTPRPQPPQQPREGPRIPPELRRLGFFAGQWEEEVRYAEGGTGRGRWLARPELGRYLIFRYEGSGPEGEYRAMGLLTYDREAQAYRMWWFDDAGGIGEYRGDWTDESNLVLEHRGKVEGRDFRERITYSRVSATQVGTRIEQAWDTEEYKLYLEAAARRTGDLPRPPGQGQRPPAPPPAD